MTVAIVGLPGVGKTTWLQKNRKKYAGYKVFEADSFRSNDFEQDMYTLRSAIRRDLSPNKLVEGVQVFRLLRKGQQLGDWYPDEVIMLLTKTDDVRKQRYFKREGRYPNPGFDKSLMKIWEDYLALWKLKPVTKLTYLYV